MRVLCNIKYHKHKDQVSFYVSAEDTSLQDIYDRVNSYVHSLCKSYYFMSIRFNGYVTKEVWAALAITHGSVFSSKIEERFGKEKSYIKAIKELLENGEIAQKDLLFVKLNSVLWNLHNIKTKLIEDNYDKEKYALGIECNKELDPLNQGDGRNAQFRSLWNKGCLALEKKYSPIRNKVYKDFYAEPPVLNLSFTVYAFENPQLNDPESYMEPSLFELRPSYWQQIIDYAYTTIPALLKNTQIKFICDITIFSIFFYTIDKMTSRFQ